MVKTPRTRHSKPDREPPTIDLGPGEVSRIEAEKAAGAAEPENMADAPQEEQAAPPAPGAEPRGDQGNGGDGNNGRDPVPPVAPVPAGGSGRAALSGAIAGAVVAALIGGGLFYALPRADDGGLGARIEGLTGEIDTIKAAQGETDSRIAALSGGLDEARSQVAALKDAAANAAPADNAALEALQRRLEDFGTRLRAIEDADQSASAGLEALSGRIAAAEAAARGVGEADAQAETRLGTLEQSVEALSAKIDAEAVEPKIARALAVSALRSAIDRGAPFGADLEALSAIAPGAPEIEKLRPYADKGVPTLAALAGEMNAAADAMVAAPRPADENAGFVDKLLGSARALVSVRPVGEVPGAGVPETVARMEAAVKAGDLDKALKEFDSLPQPAADAGRAYADKIRARRDAEQLADQLASSVLKAG